MREGHDVSALPLAEAKQVLEAATAKAIETGIVVSISVLDARGDLITMARLDGATWRSVKISHGKAYAAAAYGQPSAELEARADTPVTRSLVQMEGGHLIPAQGALPIYRAGELVGAVGASGAPSQDDEAACRAGIQAVPGLSEKA